MRFVKMLCLVGLVAMSAAAAHAGSIGSDPKVTINCIKPCQGVASHAQPNIPTFSGDLLTLAYSSLGTTFDYEYTGPTKSFSGPPYFYVDITGIPFPPSVPFSCGGDVFSSSCIYATIGITCANPGCTSFLLEDQFSLTGGPLVHDTEYSITLAPDISTTPEPSTMLMFLSLGPALAFAKKRWNAKLSA
jgi:hypothetical protein